MIKNKSHSSIFWYIIPVLYSLYYLQGYLYERGPISLISISLLLILGIIFCLKTFFLDKFRPRPLTIIFVFLLLVSFSYLISPKFVFSRNELFPLSTFIQYKDFLIFFLAIFTGYQIGLKSQLKGKQLLLCCCVFFTLAVIQYIRLHATLHELFQRDEITNNAGYFFVALLPFFILLLKDSKILGWAFIIASLCFIVYTFKRGAIVVSAVILLYISVFGNSKNKISVKSILFATLTMFISVAFFLKFMAQSDFMQKRVNATLQGDSSNRDQLYGNLWDYWLNSDIFNQLFGHGISQTVNIAGNYAHNDWLEILIDYGLIGVFLYASILISLFKYRGHLNYENSLKVCYTSIMLIWIMKTLFSMGIGIPESLSMLLLGSLIGNSVSDQRKSVIKA